jgi:hypothetical protein
MDWRYNTIWLEELSADNIFHCNYEDKKLSKNKFEDVEYAMIFQFKYKGLAFDLLPKSDKLLYLDMSLANIKDFSGISKFKNLKRLELHRCIKLENDKGLGLLSENLEFLHINLSKKFQFSKELLELKKLKVLCLNACGPIENLEFLSNFPNLIDFRFVDTNILDGNLNPILEHPTIRTVGFLNKKHYNYKSEKLKTELENKFVNEYKTVVYKGQYWTYRYDYE